MNETFANQFKAILLAKITDFKSGVAAITARSYIVGSMDESGNFSVSANPVVHVSAASALNECERLAKINHGVTYVPMQLVGGAQVPRVASVRKF